MAVSLAHPLQEHLERVRTTFDADRRMGVAGVWLPYALGRKYPGAGTEWEWQWVFPSQRISVDPRGRDSTPHPQSLSPVEAEREAVSAERGVRRGGVDSTAKLRDDTKGKTRLLAPANAEANRKSEIVNLKSEIAWIGNSLGAQRQLSFLARHPERQPAVLVRLNGGMVEELRENAERGTRSAERGEIFSK